MFAGVKRRDALQLIAVVPFAACAPRVRSDDLPAITALKPLGAGGPWPTRDPFLACMHHDDAYPAGDARMAPAASLVGRQLGRDFDPQEAWRMYHGQIVPGFPQHPHRGFETVTVVRRGLCDHSDSLGAAARYGRGDVQWLTAGAGVQHAEMFPLIDTTAPNPLELFQIWLNLPRVDKMATPRFSMLWDDVVPKRRVVDTEGRTVDVTVVAGRVDDARAPPPPPSSWAARAEADVAIWTVKMAPGAGWSLPAAGRGTNRTAYFFRGSSLQVDGVAVPARHAIELRADRPVFVRAGPDEVELLVLQGAPIGEPVVQRGPFVMNTQAEIDQAVADYRRTRFGGWVWTGTDPVHAREAARVARFADGRTERPA